MRVYVPATLPLLADLVATGSLPSPIPAYAVTDLLRTWADQSGPSDDDELELVALTEAARGSLRLLAADRSAASCRVVLAVEVPGDLGSLVRVDEGSDTGTPGQVVVTVDVPLAWLRAAHVDDTAAEAAVRTAAAAITTADDASHVDRADAEAVVGRTDEHDLLWYAPEEIAGEPWRGP